MAAAGFDPRQFSRPGKGPPRNQEETLIPSESTVASFLCSSCRCRRNRSYCDEGVGSLRVKLPHPAPRRGTPSIQFVCPARAEKHTQIYRPLGSTPALLRQVQFPFPPVAASRMARMTIPLIVRQLGSGVKSKVAPNLVPLGEVSI